MKASDSRVSSSKKDWAGWMGCFRYLVSDGWSGRLIDAPTIQVPDSVPREARAGSKCDALHSWRRPRWRWRWWIATGGSILIFCTRPHLSNPASLPQRIEMEKLSWAIINQEHFHLTSVKWTFVHIGKDVKIDLWQLQRISPTDCPDEERTFKIKLLSECCNFLVFPPRVISVGHFVIITVGALVVIIGPESDHWECLSVTHSLTNWLLFSKLDWCGPGVQRYQLKMLATVCYRFGSWRLVLKLNFCSDFEHKVGQDFEVEVQARFWSWSLFIILPLMFCRGYEVESWSRFWS